MRKLIVMLVLGILLAAPVQGAEMEFTAPQVPPSAESLLPEAPESFSQGLRTILKEALPMIAPALSAAAGACMKVIGIVMLLCVMESFLNTPSYVTRLVGVVSISLVLLSVSNTMIPLGEETITELSNYGKLLLPVMTAALAAQGGAVTSGALYTGTAFFDAVLSSLVRNMLVPCVYGFLALSLAARATGEEILDKLKSSIKGVVIWGLKTILYIFTGYMTITGAVSGSTDAMAVKAAKLTISGMVPVVGGILSDATEAVLVSAGIMRNAAGIYGILAILAVTVGPFIRLACQYLMLKLTATLCGVFASKPLCGMIEDVSSALGLVLGMTATVSVMLIISTVCFMKVVGA